MIKVNNPNDETSVVQGDVLEAAEGYDLAANDYDRWLWQEFWERNERPTIETVLRSMTFARVLDIGTGTGRYLELGRALGHEVYGIDVSKKMLELAMQRLSLSTFEPFLRIGDVRDIPFGDRLFDIVICCRVVSHVAQLKTSLSEISRVLRRGGVAAITDVDGRHNYEATRIPVEGSNVWIRVYKHKIDDIVAVAESCGLAVREARLLYAKDLLWKPSRRVFPTIDWSGVNPISYSVVLSKG